jgi:mannose-6-phosphate isomerase-like protein (cupin superfamily)
MEALGNGKAPFKAAYFTVQPGCTSPVDSHSVHEIWMVAEGEGELMYDNQQSSIRAFDMLYFEPPRSHQVRNHGTRPLVIFSVWWNNA